MRPHLLVATDFSVPAQQMTKNLGHFQNYGADKITLLHVRPLSPLVARSSDETRYVNERLDEIAGDLRSTGWEVTTGNHKGRPGSMIVATADDVDADMIVLANQGHGATSEVVLGSVATDVLERSHRPIFLFCADAIDDPQSIETTPLWDRLVCPVDFSDASTKALEWTKEIASAEWTPVVLLHAVDDRYHGERETQKRQARLDKIVEDLREKDLSDVAREIIVGPPKKMVAEAGDHYPGALFVMGTHGRGWLGDLMLGGVSRAVARRGTHHALFIPAN